MSRLQDAGWSSPIPGPLQIWRTPGVLLPESPELFAFFRNYPWLQRSILLKVTSSSWGSLYPMTASCEGIMPQMPCPKSWQLWRGIPVPHGVSWGFCWDHSTVQLLLAVISLCFSREVNPKNILFNKLPACWSPSHSLFPRDSTYTCCYQQ